MIHPGILSQVDSIETIKGEINKIIFKHRDSYILKILIGNEIKTLTLDYGILLGSELIQGEVIECSGEWVHSPLYGDQFIASAVLRKKMDESHLIVTWLTKNRAIRGVGSKTGTILIKEYGDKLSKVLDEGDIYQIMEDISSYGRKGISLDKLVTLVTAWKHYSKELKCIDYLNHKRLPFRVASFSMLAWDEHCEDILEDNPYVLSSFMRFDQLDSLVRDRWDISEDDERRIVAACEDILYQDYSTNGNTGMYVEELNQLLKNKCGFGIDKIPKQQDAVIITETGFVQAAGQLVMETFIEEKLNTINRSQCNRTFLSNTLSDYQSTLSFPLHPKQVEAIESSVVNPVSIISGGAGTGKTTVLEGAIAVFKALEREVVLLAPTGKAANRMSEATGLKAKTVCKFIGDASKNDDEYYLQGGVIIVDEVSMLDLPSCYGLLSSLPDNVNLVLVGDHRQLPPVGPGLFFHRLIQQDWVAHVKLVKTQRQDEQSVIPLITDSILAYKTPKIPPMSKIILDGCVFRDEPIYDDTISKAAKLYAAIHTRIGKELNYDMQCIAGTKRSVKTLNQLIQSAVNKEVDGKVIRQKSCTIYLPGDMVVYNENDYNKNLTNGSIGRVVDVYPDGKYSAVKGEAVRFVMTVKFEDLEDTTDITDDEFNEERISLAYAITAHKSQGSQYHTVIIALDSSRLMDNAWIYTSITRAKNACYIIGDSKLLEKACTTKPSALSRKIGVEYALR